MQNGSERWLNLDTSLEIGNRPDHRKAWTGRPCDRLPIGQVHERLHNLTATLEFPKDRLESGSATATHARRWRTQQIMDFIHGGITVQDQPRNLRLGHGG